MDQETEDTLGKDLNKMLLFIGIIFGFLLLGTAIDNHHRERMAELEVEAKPSPVATEIGVRNGR